jgi:hypothetical protein
MAAPRKFRQSAEVAPQIAARWRRHGKERSVFMRQMVARGARGVARGTQTIMSQVIVSVVTAICVALITNAYLGSDPEQKPAVVAAAAARTLPLPPLDVEIVADIPNGPAEGQEIFPGVPAGVPAAVLAEAVRATAATAAAKPEPRRRRFLGIPLPFGGETAAAGPAAAAVTTLVSGG